MMNNCETETETETENKIKKPTFNNPPIRIRIFVSL